MRSNFGSRFPPILIFAFFRLFFLRYEEVYAKILTNYNWKRFAALTENGMKYTQYITSMGSKLKDKGINLILNQQFTRESDKELQLKNFKDVSVKKNLNYEIANKFYRFISQVSQRTERESEPCQNHHRRRT